MRRVATRQTASGRRALPTYGRGHRAHEQDRRNGFVDECSEWTARDMAGPLAARAAIGGESAAQRYGHIRAGPAASRGLATGHHASRDLCRCAECAITSLVE